MKWRWLLNIDVIAVIILVCIVIYFLATTKRKKVKWSVPSFKDIDPSVSPWEIGLSKKKSKKKNKKNPKINKHEEKCRDIFQKIYGVKFKSVRPKWLKNPTTGKNLELDGFAPEIDTNLGEGLAFEYDGKQHAEYVKHFHRKGPNEFLYQRAKDKWKDAKCKERGIVLVRIPHFVAYHDLERYISRKLRKMRIYPGDHNPRSSFSSMSSGRGLYD